VSYAILSRYTDVIFLGINIDDFPDYGPSLSEHAILVAKLDPNLKVATDMDTSEGK
jgi:hypothetical protein